MFDFIPNYEYAHYFDLAVLVIVLMAVWQCARGAVFSRDTEYLNSAWGLILMVLIVFYMGARDPNGPFGDTSNYTSTFWNKADSGSPFAWTWNGEWLFVNLMNFIAKTTKNIHLFYTICAAVYVGALWHAMVRIFGRHYYIPFVVIISMFTFWQYGVNGVRNGMGASLFILAMTYVENLPVMIALSLMGAGVHKSIYIMIGAGALAWFVKNSYYYLAGWITCVILSYFAGLAIQSTLTNIPFFGMEDRLSGYLEYSYDQMVNDGYVVSTQFRWDFILYSSLAVFIGYYFIFVRKFKDEYYHWIYNIYLITNAFWVLIIRAAYSNRFAQISWFIMPIVLIYPFMKRRFWQNHERMLGVALLVFYAFTFYYNILR